MVVGADLGDVNDAGDAMLLKMMHLVQMMVEEEEHQKTDVAMTVELCKAWAAHDVESYANLHGRMDRSACNKIQSMVNQTLEKPIEKTYRVRLAGPTALSGMEV